MGVRFYDDVIKQTTREMIEEVSWVESGHSTFTYQAEPQSPVSHVVVDNVSGKVMDKRVESITSTSCLSRQS
jgi:hypothetical protein